MIEDFLQDIPEHEALLVKRLHALITEIAPELRFKLSYKVPYYFGKRRVCFIWPASKGASGIENGVILGFCEGHLLEDESGALKMEHRKQVGMIVYTDQRQINREIIQPLLLQALLVDKSKGG